MTPEQLERFRLVNTQEQTVGAPGQVMTQGMQAESIEVDEVSEGLARGVSYMARNGPVRPVQKIPAQMITRQQLEEQKMNEAAGLPSNLDEASRVVALEKKIVNMDTNMDKILQLLSQPSNAPATLVSNRIPLSPSLPQPRSAPLPTPQVSPVAPPNEPVYLNPRVVENLPVQPLTPPVQVMEPPTPEVGVQVSQPVSFQQVSPPTASPETIAKEEYAYDQEAKRALPVSLGPTGSTGPDSHEDRYELTEEISPGEIVAVAEEPTPPPEDVVETKRLSRQQMLTEQVSNWLKSKDIHKFWRQFLAGACNKNLSYNTWPPEFQGPFNEKFKEMVEDPAFVSVLCGRITKMQMGHLVAPHVAGAFVVVSAGFLAFALLEQ